MPTPIENAAPITPTAAATDTAPVKASIVEASAANRRTLPASMPRLSLVPSMRASTKVAMRLSAPAPAPLSDTPTKPPDSATAPANTVASMSWSDSASIVSAPVAFTFESRM